MTPRSRSAGPNYPAGDNPNSSAVFDPDDVATGIDLYFRYCHRQPIWCFERGELGNLDCLPEELASSILALTSPFSEKRNQMQLYSSNAKTLIMLRIANGTVDIATIESLCLLSYASFLGGLRRAPQDHVDCDERRRGED